MIEKNRRSTDRLQDDLDAMIEAENDPRARATLMCLNALNRSIAENTAITHELHLSHQEQTAKLDTHIENFASHAKVEEALINKGRGARWALLSGLGFVQILGGYVVLDTRDALRQSAASAHIAQLADQKLLTRIEILEAQKKHGIEP